MKKIVLGCAAVLLSLGLLAGCNDNPSTVDAVIINVDSSATIVVGDTLELAYTVDPAKAEVVAASDNESIVTADAQDGILYLHGVAEGSAVVTLVGTYKKYAEANTNISVKVVTEGEVEQEPGPETGGSGTGSGIGGALPEELEGEWLLGYTSGETNYYFNGKVESSYYGGVTTSDLDAVVVTATAVSDGATLTFEADGATKYIYMDESSGHHNFSWREESFTWKYDEVYETFVADDSEGAAYFMGNYGTQYQELRMSEYGYLTGEITSSNEQFAAHLYEVPTYATPTSITITGENTVAVYERITLSATITPDDADPRLTWSWASNDTGEVTVSSTGVVTGVAEGSVTVTATSVAYPDVSGSITITVTEASGEAPTAYKLGSLDTTNYCYYWFNGKTTVVSDSTYLATSKNWEDAVDVYITGISDDGIDNSCTLSFYDDADALKYITYGSSSTQLTIGDTPYTWKWNDNSGNGYFSAPNDNSRFIGELTSDGSFRAYASSNLSGYPHVQPFTDKPEDPEKPTIDVTLEEVSSIESGNQYYLGALVDEGDYQFITGTVSNYKLPTTMDISAAAEVVVTGNDTDGWTLTVNGQYIYAYVYTSGNSSSLELGLNNAETVPSNGVNVFSFDTTSHAFYTNASGAVSSYTYSYLEYYNGNVTLYGANDTSSFSSAAHLYQVVDS